MGGGGGFGVLANGYICVHGAQINFGDLTPYLAYAVNQYVIGCPSKIVSIRNNRNWNRN
jgi:hypothetical protein